MKLASIGPLYTTSAVNVPSGLEPPSNPWLNISNILGTENSSDATCNASGGPIYHDFLYCYHGGAGIGENDLIEGIQIEARLRGSDQGNHPSWEIGPVINGERVGMSVSGIWPLLYNTVTVGGSASLFGTAGLTGADVNLSNSGAYLRASNPPKGSYMANVDWLAVTYFYLEEEPGESPSRNFLTVLGVSCLAAAAMCTPTLRVHQAHELDRAHLPSAISIARSS